MFVYLSNKCLSAHLNLLFKLSCNWLRRCVPRLPLREQVLREQDGNPASIYLPVSPLSESCGLSVSTLTFGLYPVRYLDLRLTPRVSTLNSHAWPHFEETRMESYCLSHLMTHSRRNSHTPWTASASSLWLGIYWFWILDLCSPGQSQLTRLN